MTEGNSEKPPLWFWIVSALFLIWGLAGCFSIYLHLTLGAAMTEHPDAWEQALNASIPGWFIWVYLLAVGGGVLGALALLLRSRHARPLFAASILGVVIQFAYVFLATDMVAHKGAAATVPFPLLIFVLALVQYWLAGIALRRRWIS